MKPLLFLAFKVQGPCTFCIDNNILWVFKCVQSMRIYSVGHLYLQFLYFLDILLKFVSAKLLISSFL